MLGSCLRVASRPSLLCPLRHDFYGMVFLGGSCWRMRPVRVFACASMFRQRFPDVVCLAGGLPVEVRAVA